MSSQQPVITGHMTEINIPWNAILWVFVVVAALALVYAWLRRKQP